MVEWSGHHEAAAGGGGSSRGGLDGGGGGGGHRLRHVRQPPRDVHQELVVQNGQPCGSRVMELIRNGV